MSPDVRPAGAQVRLAMLGSTTGPQQVAWSERDVMLYALGVGAGVGPPGTDLALVTENSEGARLTPLPSFATTFPIGLMPPALLGLDRGRFLHAEQSVDMLRPLPAEGRAMMETRVAEVLDKGSGALLVNLTTLEDGDGLLARLRSTLFVRGGGGFGGPRGESAPAHPPDRPADVQVVQATRPEQALLYRLSGDRNPLHSDPSFARARGFERPILHGLCTYGFACRALATAAGNGGAERLTHMRGRFSKPVFPGDSLTTEIWRLGGGEVAFRVSNGARETVIEQGAARFAG